MTYLKTAIFINGIYDIVSGALLLNNSLYHYSPHNYILNEKCCRRYFAFWVITYGTIRLFYKYNDLVVLSYLIESAAISHETSFLEKSTKEYFCTCYKHLFVIFSSLFLAAAATASASRPQF